MNKTPPFVLIGTKTYTLYKRSDKEDSPWWFRIQRQGKRLPMSTGTANAAEACEIVKRVADEILSGTWTGASKLVNKRGGRVATIGAVVKLADPEYGRRLVELIKEATGKKVVDELPCDILTRALVGAFQARKQGLKRPDYDLPHENNGQANSILNHAKSAFSRKAMLAYEAAGLNLPSLEGFMSAPGLPDARFRYSDHPLSPAKLAKIAAALPSIDKKLQAEHLRLALTGAPSEMRKEHAAWLNRFSVTPEQVRWHCGAIWLRKTGSMKLAAEKMDVTYAWAYWHYSQLKVKPAKLELGDL